MSDILETVVNCTNEHSNQ